MPINSTYSRFVVKSADYTAKVEDDYITTTLSAPATITLPKAGTCLYPQNQKYVIADPGNSSNDTTIAVQSGDTLDGISTVSAGANVLLAAFGNTWVATGGTGTAGTSGASGKSGFSGTSGTVGTSGTSGATGTSGTSGTSGFSGASGASGKSGFSGVSGAA